jgi:hypothetical protein
MFAARKAYASTSNVKHVHEGFTSRLLSGLRGDPDKLCRCQVIPG